jgi:Fic family protein
LLELVLRTRTVRLMAEIAESKGRQQIFARQAPQLLRALRAATFVRGVQFSARRDGVVVAPDRLYSLIWGHTKPLNRSEKQIRSYARALSVIHSGGAEFQITPNFLRRVHEAILVEGKEAGQWRTQDNAVEDLSEGRSTTFTFTFQGVPATEVPSAVEELCSTYSQVLQEGQVHPLVAVAAFVFDFECLHPFREGHARVSHLLTLLSLSQHGFEIGRVVSLERCFEQSREDYFNALRLSSVGWREGSPNLNPWVEYFFTVLKRAYQEFEHRIGAVTSPRGAKTVLVETAVDGFPSAFTFSELEQTCPGVSRVVVYRVLRQLKKRGEVERSNRGSVVTWRKINKTWVDSAKSDLAGNNHR